MFDPIPPFRRHYKIHVAETKPAPFFAITHYNQPPMLNEHPIATAFTAGILLVGSYKLLQIGRREADLPPGPPTLPLLGNLASFPKKFRHFKFTEWANEYGAVISLKLGSGTIVVLNSLESVKEVFEKQSVSTSNRPRSVVAEQITRGLHFGVINPGPAWRAYHRAAREVLSPHAAMKHRPIQAAEITQLVWDILETPKDFFTHCQRCTSSIVFSIVCGKRAPRFQTPFVTEFFTSIHQWTGALESGAILDFLPFLQYLPPWPSKLARVRKFADLYENLVVECERREAKGLANGCQLESVRARAGEWGLTRDMTGAFAAVLTEAGSGTSVTFMHNLILLMMAYPEVQKRAQEEIDAVVGRDRAPVWEDLQQMPYVQAIIKEIHRFRPSAPLGFPHSAAEDVMCGQYRIPKDTIIFMNTWKLTRDPTIFDAPDTFNPDRYLEHPVGLGEAKRREYEQYEKDGHDNILKMLAFDGLMWGIGRRRCPGQHLATATFYLSAMHLLWAFNFCKPQDATGNVIEPNLMNYKQGVVMCLLPFESDIKVRSQCHESIIRRDYHHTSSIFEPFEQELTMEDRIWAASTRDNQPTTLFD